MASPLKKSFFLLLLAAGIFSCAGAETVITYRSQRGVPLSASAPLRRFEEFLKDLFPGTFYRKTPLIIDITGKGEPLPPVSGEVFEADLARLQQGGIAFYSEIGGAMLYAWGKAPAGFRVPYFICGAFRHWERSMKNEGRFLGNNRRIRSAESLLRLENVPDLKKLLEYCPDEKDAADNEWFDDHSRLLLELLRRRRFRGKAEEMVKEAEKLLAKGIDAGVLRSMVWGRFNPLPPELVDKTLEKMLKIEIPKLDHKNEPSSLKETVTAAQLPAKLAKHPLRREICSSFASQVFRQMPGLPSSFRGVLRRLHDGARQLGRDPEAEPAFRLALENLEKFRKLYGARSAALDAAENTTPLPVRMWKKSLESNGAGSLFPPESRRFLDRMEEYYSGV